ncbi:ABC transporter ATP-binding protein [Chitinimonas sp. BJB300]|uniref:ABC transporter ATP-binding protein n=1 Tax=Chitinimonas sp. BJB300 TaxID=1559339 RepID=UPI000C0E1FCD|nr:ABC transporter ATP-binding protein [Chitinimonas sp. BJB300]PHV09721.1 lipase [Chitinimonas sp. BJB300]TSJ90090.1 ABC transporter ATP-binding protein [Chitinimonas sp. BJB300]
MTKLIVNDLHLQYGDNPILKGVSFELQPGEVVALLGASGSGKTTLLRAVAGLESPHQGCISIGGQSLYDAARGIDLPVEKRGLGLVFQSYALWPHKTVFDNVAYGLTLRGTSKQEIDDRVLAALKSLDLVHLAERFPNQLSGGQQQRVAIARALVYNPPVILLDEPLSNLDAKLREEARAWLRELIVTLKLSALCVTHDQTEAMAMADRILLLKNGRIEQEGRPEEMYGAPSTLYTAEFMGNNNRLQGRVTELRDGRALLEGPGWRCWGAVRGSLKMGDAAVGLIRLERVRLADGDGENRIAASLVTSMYLGDRWEYLFKPGENRLRAYGEHAIPANTPAWLELPVNDLWLFPSDG